MVEQLKVFTESVEHCSSLSGGAHLAHIEDQETDEFIKESMLANENATYRIGIFLNRSRGLYWKENSHEVDYLPWKQIEDVTYFTSTVITRDGWKHVSPKNTRQFICQAEADFLSFRENNTYYKFFPFGKNWTNANEYCKTTFYNGKLAEPINSKQRKAIDEITKEAKLIAWIGASDLVTENVFVWTSSGRNLSTKDSWWSLNNPDNWQNREHCVVVNVSSKINDCDCSYRFPFICEIDVSPTNHTDDPCFPYMGLQQVNGVCQTSFVSPQYWTVNATKCAEKSPISKSFEDLEINEKLVFGLVDNQLYSLYSCKNSSYHQKSNTCLKLFPKKTFSEAEEFCKNSFFGRTKSRGRLVEILDQDMDDFIKLHVLKTNTDAFIGLYRNMSESFQFVGSLQTPLYFGWNSTRTGSNETVAMTTVGWTTHHAQAKMRFICQKSFDSKQSKNNLNY
ncbi:uncharacterized protein LOC131956143 [Physella acuta]|uniref:uncharacterized protein LOC131956143 n=1 Tax=Physella acuta TaxID=109671 RepID=UPI0027DADF24|nr:uncharacterized protein LOC131956143 [Physella acuta]